jgi:nicotinamidase-related amidase
MSYTLAVIDMQDHFLNRFEEMDQSNQRVFDNCKNEIAKAISDNANILFVEYEEYGPTNPELLGLVNDSSYNSFNQIIKIDDNGSREIVKAVKKFGLPKKKIKICGINTEYCVYATVKGLLQAMRESKIEVLTDACDSPWDHEVGVEILENLTEGYSNLKIK